MQKRTYYLIVFLICIGIFFRIVNIDWGAPFYFHPDERNIATLVAVTPQVNSLFTGTFAYGNFLILIGLLLRTLIDLPFGLSANGNTFSQAILILRFFSFASSLGVLYFLYLSGKYWSPKTSLIAVLLATFSVGLIQQSHFGTFDMFITCCLLGSFYFLVLFYKTNRNIWYFFSLFAIILASAAKITASFIFILPLVVLFLSKKRFEKKIILGTIGLFLISGLPLVLSPYYLTHNFFSGIFYEKGVVDGSLPVFYTQSFTHTIPLSFQFLSIYPFLLNPLIEFIFIPCFFCAIFFGLKKKDIPLLILIAYFLLLFIPNAFLFAKWTRYMLPTIPFIYLVVAIVLSKLQSKKNKLLVSASTLFSSLLILISCIFALAYVKTVFFQNDPRIIAATYMNHNFQSINYMLTEPYDLGILPFYTLSPHMYPFDFYTLDQNSQTINDFTQKLVTADSILLPSQRLLRSRLLNKTTFPYGAAFYSHLLDGSLGFSQIYQTPCDFWCSIIYLNNPIFSYEETVSVFDRPTVLIFKKEKKLSVKDYLTILKK